MSYQSRIQPDLEKKLIKLLKKGKKQYERVFKKMNEIVQNPYIYKHLRYNMKGERRVHIDSFVLTFSIKEDENVVIFLNYDHHDKIYLK